MNAISMDEAFAQGSSWAQIYSIATFHERLLNAKLKAAAGSTKKMATWKANAARRQLEAEVAAHQMRVDYFRGLAHRMRTIGDRTSASAR